MKLKLLKFVIFLTVLLSVTAWSATPPSKPLTVILDWFVNPDHAPLIIAEQNGYFKQAGLNVRLIAPADPSDPPKLVAAGQADLALDYQPGFLISKSQGLPLVQVGTLINRPLNCLAVLASSPIKTLKDLRGKRIGYSTAGVDYASLKIMLAQQGLTLHDVRLINVHYNLVQALLAHRIDAAIGLMRNVEIPEMSLLGHPARTFYPEDYGFPNYAELIFVARPAEAQDPRIPLFLKAVQRGAAYVRQHPEQSWQIFIKAYPEDNNALNKKSWQLTIPYFAQDPGALNPAECQRLAAALQRGLKMKMSAAMCHPTSPATAK